MTRDDRLLAEMALRNWIILGLLVGVSLFWQSWAISLGVLSGGVLVIINNRLLGRSLVKLLANPHQATEKGFKRNYLFRLVFVSSAIYLLLVRAGVDPLALVVGLSVVVINMFVTMIKRLY